MAKIRDKQPDADAGRKIVDEQLEGLEARLTSMYGNTAKEVQADLDKFLDKYKKADAEKQEMVEAGELTEKEYLDWRERQIFRTNAMKAKIDDLTARVVNADKQAMAMVNDQLPETYATSYNFGGYRGETLSGAAGFDYTQFTIINQDAVRTLATEDPDLIPWKSDVDVPEDEKWNRKHVQEAVYQGITKGDSMDDVAKRLLPVVNMDKNAAIRTARTAVNGIENKGRKDATERVREAGIPMVETWSCTHDNRTRDTHILLDGTTPDDNGMFGKGILSILMAYPGDPAGDPAEVYNCRCGLVSSIKGIDHSKDDELYAQMMEEEYFEDWVQVKEDRQEKEAAFQSKKEGAAERVAAKMAQFDENNASLTKEDSEDIKENSIFGLDLNTPHYENFSDTFQEIIPDYADRVARGDYPTMKELRELYKKAETEQDELLLEFLTNSQTYIQTYKNFSDDEKRQYAEIFSVLRNDSDTPLYRGESGEWVKHYGEFTEGKTITFDSFGFTTPHDRDELEAMKSYDVLFEFEKGTPCINTANQVWDDHLILGNFEIVSADQYENGQQHVVLRYIDSQPEELPDEELPMESVYDRAISFLPDDLKDNPHAIEYLESVIENDYGKAKDAVKYLKGSDFKQIFDAVNKANEETPTDATEQAVNNETKQSKENKEVEKETIKPEDNEEIKETEKTEPPFVTFETKTFDSARDATEYFRGSTYDSKLGTMGKAQGFGVREEDNKPATKWQNKLTYDQTVAVNDYTGNSYEPVNNFLRGVWDKKEANDNMTGHFTIDKTIKQLDGAINKYDLKENITVYRTCEREFADKLIEGQTFHDEGYGSTTVVRDNIVASGDVFIEIDVPAGKGVGAYVDGLSWKEGEEFEFLLGRGADYYVAERRETKEGIFIKAVITGFTK